MRIKLPGDLKKRLDLAARAGGVSPATVVRELLVSVLRSTANFDETLEAPLTLQRDISRETVGVRAAANTAEWRLDRFDSENLNGWVLMVVIPEMVGLIFNPSHTIRFPAGEPKNGEGPKGARADRFRDTEPRHYRFVSRMGATIEFRAIVSYEADITGGQGAPHGRWTISAFDPVRFGHEEPGGAKIGE